MKKNGEKIIMERQNYDEFESFETDPEKAKLAVDSAKSKLMRDIFQHGGKDEILEMMHDPRPKRISFWKRLKIVFLGED